MIYVWDNGESHSDHSIAFYECPLGKEDVAPFLNVACRWKSGELIGIISIVEDLNLGIEPIWFNVVSRIEDCYDSISDKLLYYSLAMMILNGLPTGWHEKYKLKFLDLVRKRIYKSGPSPMRELATAAHSGDVTAASMLHDYLTGSP